MSLGYGVTWDNPDIEIRRDGTPVSPHDLAPGTEYEIVARIWNGSTEAPAVHLRVAFSYLTFGVGTETVPIGDTYVDLPVRGGVGHPAFARHLWTTPPEKGHFCLQVHLDWPDDENPRNNLGQQNTDVRSFNSPQATFEFVVRNSARESWVIDLEADTYVLGPPPSCEEQSDGSAVRERALARHSRRHFPVQSPWRVDISPTRLDLRPGEQRRVRVTVTAPSDHYTGRKSINVHAFASGHLLGGVTLHSEG